MRIDVNRIPQEGQTLEEEFAPEELDLETDSIKFRDKIKVKAQILKITNAVTIDVNIRANMFTNCSRCLKEYQIDLKKNTRFNYSIDKSIPFVDLNQDIREEIVLDYPIKPLCKFECKGLCMRCGKNLNEGSCNCGAA